MKKFRLISGGVIFASLVMMLLCCTPAFADDVTLDYVIVNDSSFPLNGTADMTIAGSFAGGTRPGITLQFSNNVTNSSYLQDNIALISMYNEGGALIPITLSTTTISRDIVVTPLVLLPEGRYHIVARQGITRTGSGYTVETYTINFTVGPQAQEKPDDGIPKTTVAFKVGGVSGTTVFILVTNESTREEYMARPDGTLALPTGNYSYVVSASAYVTSFGSFSIGTVPLEIPVEMTDKVEFTIYVTPADAVILVSDAHNNEVKPAYGTTYLLTPSFEYTYVLSKPGYLIQTSRLKRIDSGEFHYELQPDPNYNPLVYGWQGTAGQRLLMLSPGAESIEPLRETPYYYNEISVKYNAEEAINFSFTMDAGFNSFDEGNFKARYMPLIAVYKDYDQNGPVGEPLAQYDSGEGLLKFVDYVARNRDVVPETPTIVNVGLASGVLPTGHYVLVFNKNIASNNQSKTLGQDVVFGFTVVGAGMIQVHMGVNMYLDGIRFEPEARDLNGNQIEAFIHEGVTYLPLRALSETLGLRVDWDGATQSVHLWRGGAVQPSGQPSSLPLRTTSPMKTIRVYTGVNMYLDGVKFEPDAKDLNGNRIEALIHEGVTYLPLRALSEALKLKVDWDGTTQSVYLSR